MYKAEIIADSYSEESEERLTTFVISYPRFVHSELMTHRMFSRNSSSSRAIPNHKLLEKIRTDPVMPVWWGKNQPGMQAAEQIDNPVLAEMLWLEARQQMLDYSSKLSKAGVHKQIVNRLLEPWMFITVIVTGTHFENFFHLRTPKEFRLPQNNFDPDFPAQPEIQVIANKMLRLYTQVEPDVLKTGDWHLPFITDQEKIALPVETLRNLSVARCARVSYLTHDGELNFDADIKLFHRLSGMNHWSPFEHQAEALATKEQVGNFTGWKQYRKFFEDENYTGNIIE